MNSIQNILAAITWWPVIVAFIITIILLIYYIKNRIDTFLIATFIAALCVFTLIGAKYMYYENVDTFNEALQYEKQGDYISAVDTYNTIPGFNGVDERLEEIKIPYTYQRAIKYEELGEYDKALILYLDIQLNGKTYLDTDKHIQYCVEKYIEQEGLVK